MQEQQITDREPTLGSQQHGQEQQEGRPCQQSPGREQPQRCAPKTAPDRQQLQPQQHRDPSPLHPQQHAPSASSQLTHPRLQLAPVCQHRYDELEAMEATLMSPDPFCPRRFIMSEATVSPVHKKHKALALDVSDKDTAAQEEQGLATPRRQQQASAQLAPVSSAGLATGTMAAMLAAEAARSAALERYSSMSLLSPSGGFFSVPMRTPRFSAVLAADMEPQEPQSARTAAAAAAGAGAASVGGVKAADAQSPGTALAGSKRRFEDQCTEICETAQAVAMSSPTQGGGPSLAALQQWQQTIEAAEHQWGSSHPAVGRAWLELARALQAADKDSDRAKHATKKAFDICQILLQQTGTESHAQDSFEYLLAKFNTKSLQQKQAAADSARGAAQALEATTSAAAAAAAAAAETCLLPLSAPMVAAMQLSAPMLMPFDVPGSPAAAAEQMQMPYMQSTCMQYAPSGQHMALQGLQGLPAIHVPLGGALSTLPPVSGSPAAQVMAADMQAAALMMSCGYPSAALLPHAALLHAAGTPTAADCLGLMPPSLLYGSPGSGRHLAAAAGAPATHKAAGSQAGKASNPTGALRAAAAQAQVDSKAAAGCDRSVASDDQGQGAQPKAKVVLNL